MALRADGWSSVDAVGYLKNAWNLDSISRQSPRGIERRLLNVKKTVGDGAAGANFQ